MVAAAVVGGVVAAGVGGSIAASGARDAAQTQADAANRSTDIQNSQWQQTQQNMKPYLDLGNAAINPLQQALGYNSDWSANSGNPLQQQFTAPTVEQAQATPGYQFTRDQGLKSVQNSAAARGLGTSGAALKGASSYATGLADSTYNDVYNRALQTYQTNYNSAANNANRLQTLVGSGQNAAGSMGALGTQTAGNIGNTLMSGANASAAGMVGSANALAGGMNGVGNSAMVYGLTQNNSGSGSGGGIGGWLNQQYAMGQANPNTTQGADLNAINGTGSTYTGL